MPDKNYEDADRRIHDAFTATARPSPSPYFNSKLRVALAEEKRRKRAAKARMRIMQAYWIVAGLAAVLIISILPWSESPNLEPTSSSSRPSSWTRTTRSVCGPAAPGRARAT